MRLATTIGALVASLLLAAACADDPPPAALRLDSRAPDYEGGAVDAQLRPVADLLADRTRPDLPRPDQARPVASSTQAVSFSHKTQPFQGIAYDTGWQPSGSPVQVRFTVAVVAQVEATLPGTATLKRDTALALAYAGSPSAGKLSMDIGFQMSALLKIDTTLVKWEGSSR
jgi:hypothetical protein